MTEMNKYGALIDTCLSCGGIWLDKGELGKIMSQMQPVGASLDQEIVRRPVIYKEQHGSHDRSYDDHHHDKHRKKKSLFDFFD